MTMHQPLLRKGAAKPQHQHLKRLKRLPARGPKRSTLTGVVRCILVRHKLKMGSTLSLYTATGSRIVLGVGLDSQTVGGHIKDCHIKVFQRFRLLLTTLETFPGVEDMLLMQKTMKERPRQRGEGAGQRAQLKSQRLPKNLQEDQDLVAVEDLQKRRKKRDLKKMAKTMMLARKKMTNKCTLMMTLPQVGIVV